MRRKEDRKMTGIWAEKPSTFTGVSSYHPVRPAYDAVEMDAWLEKLKAEWNQTQFDEGMRMVLTERFLKAEKKLDAVRNYIENLKGVPQSTMMKTSTIAEILEKILDAETVDSQQLRKEVEK